MRSQLLPDESSTAVFAVPKAPTADAIGGRETVVEQCVPTFAAAGRRSVDCVLGVGKRRRKPRRLTRRGALMTLGLTSLFLGRWVYANQSPEWPVFTDDPTTAPMRAMLAEKAEARTPNAAHFYSAAMDTLDVDAAAPAQDIGLPRESLPELRKAVAANTEALRWFHEGAKYDYKGLWGGKTFKTRPVADLSTPVPNFVRVRSLARLVAAQSAVQLADGKTAEALTTALDLMKYGRDFSHGDTLIEAMIGVLVENIGLDAAHKAALGGSLNSTEAKELLARLDNLAPASTAVDAIQGEYRVSINTLHSMDQGTGLGLAATLDLPSGMVQSLMTKGVILIWTKRGLVDGYTAYMEESRRRARLPISTVRRLPELNTDANPITSIMAPNTVRIQSAFARNAARADLLRISLASKAYKGIAPTLRTLVEASLLESVPLDPFSEGAAQEMRFDGVKAWSVGENGIDEGGQGDDLAAQLYYLEHNLP